MTVILTQTIFCEGGGGRTAGVSYADCILGGRVSERWRGSMRQITNLVLDWKIPVWLIEMTFLGETEIALKSGIKATFGIMGF